MKKEDNILKGKDMLTSYAHSKGYSMTELLQPAYMDKVMHKYGFQDWDSVLAAIGHGGLKEGQVLNKLAEQLKKDKQSRITDEDILQKSGEKENVRTAHTAKGGIVVQGIDDVAVRFSKCCSPLPGDEIVGFVTRGRGVTIHRTDCINILNMPEIDRSRLIEAEWSEGTEKDSSYTAGLILYAKNRKGLLVDISRIFSEKDIDLSAMNVRTSKQGTATIDMSFEVRDKDQLRELMEKLRQIDSVLSVERSRG